MLVIPTYNITGPVRSLQSFLRFYSSKKSASSSRWLDRANRDSYTKSARFHEYKSRAAFKLLQLDNKYHIFRPGQSVVDLGFSPGAWTQVAIERTSPFGRVLGVDIIPTNPPKGASALQGNILSVKTHKLIHGFFTEVQQKKSTDPNDDILNHPSYIESELTEKIATDEDIDGKSDKARLDKIDQFPIDVVISDMYAPIYPPDRYWNNTTNSAYARMANTTGLTVKDHTASINLCDAALILAIDLLRPNGCFVCKFYTGAEDKGLERRLQRVFKKVVREKPDASRPESKECYFIGLSKKRDVNKIQVFS